MIREECLTELKNLVKLSGIKFDKTWEMANNYWPDAYAENRNNSPWLLVRTPRGMIYLGWRKRVIEINWSDTDIRQIITEDDVTKGDYLVHAWGIVKALEYLTKIGILL